MDFCSERILKICVYLRPNFLIGSVRAGERGFLESPKKEIVAWVSSRQRRSIFDQIEVRSGNPLQRLGLEPPGKHWPPWRCHMGTFRKPRFITTARRSRVLLVGLLGYEWRINIEILNQAEILSTEK